MKQGLRWDQLIHELYPEWSRGQIQELIAEGSIEYQDPKGLWVKVSKAGAKYSGDNLVREQLRVLEPELLKYVSRGALKLKAALDLWDISIQGKLALDVGLSTGGFSDLLLQCGADRVLGVDVGQGQVHAKLRNDPRLMWFDKVNAREPLPSEVLESFFRGSPARFDLIVIDVSFISLKLILPPLVPMLSTTGGLVALVKPQFELDKSALNKKGVVKRESDNRYALDKITQQCQDLGLIVVGSCPSPIGGENGNQEHLIYCQSSPGAEFFDRL